MVEFLVNEGDPVEYKQPVVVISPFFGELGSQLGSPRRQQHSSPGHEAAGSRPPGQAAAGWCRWALRGVAARRPWGWAGW